MPYGPRDPVPAADRPGGRAVAEACAAILWAGAMLYACSPAPTSAPGSGTSTAGGDRARAPPAGPDRPRRRPGLGGQPRLADLRPGDPVDGLPAGLSAILSTLFIRSRLAALGIVLRGASFAFRKCPRGSACGGLRGDLRLSAVLTPFFLGAALGGIASDGCPRATPPATCHELINSAWPLTVGASPSPCARTSRRSTSSRRRTALPGLECHRRALRAGGDARAGRPGGVRPRPAHPRGAPAGEIVSAVCGVACWRWSATAMSGAAGARRRRRGVIWAGPWPVGLRAGR